MMEEAIVSVPRMNCGGCLKKVTAALQELPGVSIITSDLPGKTLHLRYDGVQTSMEQIRIALENAHYAPGDIQPVAQAAGEICNSGS